MPIKLYKLTIMVYYLVINNVSNLFIKQYRLENIQTIDKNYKLKNLNEVLL